MEYPQKLKTESRNNNGTYLLVGIFTKKYTLKVTFLSALSIFEII